LLAVIAFSGPQPICPDQQQRHNHAGKTTISRSGNKGRFKLLLNRLPLDSEQPVYNQYERFARLMDVRGMRCI
jgi:hypothetical protein